MKLFGNILFVLMILMIFSGCEQDNSLGEINSEDTIDESDEEIIKEFRSHHGYSGDALDHLQIDYLGNVDGYQIYFVPFEGSSGVLNPQPWTVEGFVFPVMSHTQIMGVKGEELYTLGELIHETTISVQGVYGILPESLRGDQLTNDLPEDYSYEMALAYGDVISMGGEVTNLMALEDFIGQVDRGEEGQLRITGFTIEGDAIITLLYYHDGVLEYYNDNTRDAYGSPRIHSIMGDSIEKTVTEDGTLYELIAGDRREYLLNVN